MARNREAHKQAVEESLLSKVGIGFALIPAALVHARQFYNVPVTTEEIIAMDVTSVILLLIAGVLWRRAEARVQKANG